MVAETFGGIAAALPAFSLFRGRREHHYYRTRRAATRAPRRVPTALSFTPCGRRVFARRDDAVRAYRCPKTGVVNARRQHNRTDGRRDRRPADDVCGVPVAHSACWRVEPGFFTFLTDICHSYDRRAFASVNISFSTTVTSQAILTGRTLPPTSLWKT